MKINTFHSGPGGQGFVMGGGGEARKAAGKGVQLHLFMNIPVPPKLGFRDLSEKAYLLQ